MVIKYIRFLIKNYLFAVLALAFTIAYWFSAKDLPEKATDIPRAILLMLVPLFIWNGANSIREFKKLLKDEEIPEETKWECGLHITRTKVVVTLITVVYLILTPVVGFFACTIVYLAALAFYLGVRKALPLILFSLLFTAALYGIFVIWLQIHMPSGILF